jgi:membrane protein implicated in regulation of membrane protease activity
MPNSFWAWTIVTVVIAAVALLTRDRYTAPWAAGAACATLLEGLRVDPRWGWAAFLVVSSVLFVIFNVRRGKHSRGSRGMVRENDGDNAERQGADGGEGARQSGGDGGGSPPS